MTSLPDDLPLDHVSPAFPAEEGMPPGRAGRRGAAALVAAAFALDALALWLLAPPRDAAYVALLNGIGPSQLLFLAFERLLAAGVLLAGILICLALARALWREGAAAPGAPPFRRSGRAR